MSLRSDGCNHQSASQVEAMWGIAANYAREEPVRVEVAICLCCGGPAQAEFVELQNGQHVGVNLYCRLCQESGAAD